MKKSVAILMIIVLLATLCAPNLAMVAKAEKLSINSDAEVKLYSTATLNEEFSDNRVLVVMNNKTSLQFNEYNQSNFTEIDCVSVRDMSNGASQKVRMQYDALMDAVTSRSAVPDYVNVDYLSKYNQIICLELEQPGKKNVLAAIETLEDRDDILYVGPDYIFTMDTLSSTTYNDQYISDQWAIEDIQLPDAWEITTGSSNVVVGVIDCGIQASHPDLAGKVNVAMSADFSTDTTVTGTALDPIGHGTHVAGIIAANGNNNVGVAGVCANVTLVSLKVFASDGTATTYAQAAAIDYAEDLDIPILNMSFGKYASYDDNIPYREAIENYSGLAVCAAGNDNHNNDNEFARFPASFEFPHVLAVGASTESGGKADFSNYGQTNVDIFAPGEDILSCYTPALCARGTHDIVHTVHKANGYHFISGTSMAVPYVTGVAALLLAKNPSLTATEIKAIIMMTCTKEASLSNYCASGGRLNAYNAVLNANIYRTLSINSGITNTISNEDYQWYKFTATQAAWYSFYTNGSTDMVGELFAELVPNDITTGQLVYSDSVSDLTLNISANNFSFRYYLSKGQTVYLRVSTDDASGTYQIRVIRS